MAEEFYASKTLKGDEKPIEIGLNSTLVLKEGKLVEETWKSGGKYGAAIEEIIYWLKLASSEAENETQKNALLKLI